VREFADDTTSLVEPDRCLPPEGDDGFTDFECLGGQTLSEGKKLHWGPTVLCKMFSKPRGDDRVGVIIELPLLDLGKASANVFGKRVTDGNMGHVVSWMSETLEIGFGFAFSLEGGGVTGLAFMSMLITWRVS